MVAAGIIGAALILIQQIARPGGSRGVPIPPTKDITQVTGWALPLLLSSVALGFVVMAIVQLLKPPIRAQFHLRQISRWLGESTGAITHDAPQRSEKEPLGSEAPWQKLSTTEFLRRVTHAEPEALLELPIEQLTAQIQAAAELALAAGSDLDPLVSAVAGDIEKVAVRKLPSVEPPQTAAGTPSAGPMDRKALEAMERRNALSYTMQRRLDALQIEVRQRWRRSLRLLCIFVSATITIVLASVFGLWVNIASTALVIILLSTLGGYFASVARDAVAILERLRM